MQRVTVIAVAHMPTVLCNSVAQFTAVRSRRLCYLIETVQLLIFIVTERRHSVWQLFHCWLLYLSATTVRAVISCDSL